MSRRRPAAPAAPPPAANPLAALRAGLEATAAPMVLLDAGKTVVHLTAAAADLLGQAADGIAGRPWPAFWATVCPDDVPLGVEPRRTAVRRAGQAVPVRAWQRPLAGTPLHLVGLEDLSAEDAQEREVLRIFRDSQRQADDLFALYQITQFLNTAQELDQLCTIFLRELTRLTGAECACLYLAGAGAGLQPKVWQDLEAPPPQADDAAAIAWFRAQVGERQVLALPLLGGARPAGLALLAQRAPPARELRFLHTAAKEMGTALLVMRNRQALLAQEQKLEAILAGTTDAIIQVDAACRVRAFNPAAEQLIGLRADEVLAGACRDVLGCTGAAGCGGACPFARVLATREPIPYTELRVAGRDGLRHVAASVAALDLGPAAAPAAVAILRDMTRQKQIEQMKADFVAGVSHQLRTPLALLRGYTDTLLHLDLSPEEERTCVGGIAETTARLEHLVEQILDVTRIEDARLALAREPVRLVDLVRGAITALPYTAYRSRIWTELAPDLPLLNADPGRLEQVLINLLDNALKYSSPTGQVVIRAAAAGGSVQVQILDEGIGVLPEDQPALFQKFQRGSNARAGQVPGTGLGLFICRSIVEAHGGRISLASTPRAGTCVTFVVPAAGGPWPCP